MAAKFPIKGGLLQGDMDGGSNYLTSLRGIQVDSSAVSVIGETKHVFIAFRTDGKTGSGLQLDPYDGSTQAKFDAILSDNTKTPSNCTIHILPGTFITKGFLNTFGWSVRSGWKFILTPQTTMQFPVFSPADVALLENGVHIATMFGSTALAEDIIIDGGLFDFNLQNQTSTICINGLVHFVDGLTVRNAKFINWGSTTSAECFVVGAGSNGGLAPRIHAKGVLYDNLDFYGTPAGVTMAANTTLLNPCGGYNVANSTSLSNGWFKGGEVRSCRFHDIGGTFGVVCINLGGWVQGLNCHDNTFIDIAGSAQGRFAYYWDTGSGDTINIGEGDVCVRVNSPISFLSLAANVRKNVTISGAIIAESKSGIGIAETASASNFVIQNNFVQTTNADNSCIHVDNVVGVSIRNNICDLTPAGLGTEIATVGSTNVERFNNRKLNRTAVPGENVPGGTGDVSSNTSSSTDFEIALFSGSGGKTIKRATGTGVARINSGRLDVAVAKTDYWDITDMIASGASHAHGLVPAPPVSAGTSKYLREDGTWVVPPAASGVTIAATALVIKGDGAGGGVAGTPGNSTGDYVAPSVALGRMLAATQTVSGGTPAINWNTSDSWQITLSANATFTFTNVTDNWEIIVAVTNTGSNYTVTWPTVTWIGGVAPTQTIGAHTDVWGFWKMGSVLFGAVLQNY